MAVFQKFNGFSLRWQICSLAAVALIISIAVMGWLAFNRSRELVQAMTIQKMQAQSDAVVGNIESEIERLRSDVTAVPTFPPIPGILRTIDNRVEPGKDPLQTGSTTEIWIDRLAQIIRAQIHSYPARIEYAVYDEQGQGIMKVVVADETGEAELVVDEIAPIDRQNLYLKSIRLEAGEVFFSAAIEEADRAVDTRDKLWIYASTPFFAQKPTAPRPNGQEGEAEGESQAETEGQTADEVGLPEDAVRSGDLEEFKTFGPARGVFVIKVNGNRLLDRAFDAIERIEDQSTEENATAFEVIDQDMRFLYVHDSTYRVANQMTTFDELRPHRARLLRRRRDDQYDRNQDRFGAMVTSQQRGGDASLIATHHRIFFNAPEDRDRYWVVAMSTTANDALAAISGLAVTYLTVGAVVCGLAILFLFWVASKLTASLSRLSRSADRIVAGDLNAAIAESGGTGEVSILETSFRKMTAHLQKLLADAEEQTQRTDAIFNATADGLITIDEDAMVTSFNTSAERLFGYTSQEVVGQNVSVLIAPPHREEHDQYLQRYCQTGEARIIGADRQLEAIRKDGTVFPISLRVSELRRHDERLFIGLVQDITKRDELEAERTRLFDAIGDAVQRLTSTSQEILATTTEQAAGAQQQAASVSEVVATADEIAQSASQAALHADEVAESAQHTDKVGLTGLGAIEQSTAAMENVKTQVESIANRILSLAESAQQIGDITDAVHEIAEQTNILALNAAVEASRAGEHGKGFAVVAAEVKNLAQESKKATDQVTSILSDIQKATHAAVLSTEKGTHTVNEASDIIAEAGETIHSLAATLAQSAETATHISETANQQAAAVGQLNQGIRNIDTVTHQSVQAIRQIEVSAQNLAALSDELAKLTQQRREVHV